VEISIITGRNNWYRALVYWFVKRSKRKKIEEVYKTPIERATSLLTLERKELAKGEVKIIIVN
jgi:hypothetical protein